LTDPNAFIRFFAFLLGQLALARRLLLSKFVSRVRPHLPAKIAVCYLAGMSANDLITIDPDVLGGTPVFRGTRVPVKTLFDYLEDNYSLDEFLECFPSVTREMARRILECSESALLEPVAA
jgi:uncharacterized protein (DUF433 family)